MKKPFSLIVIFLLCFSMFAVFAPKANASNSLIGYWKFDEGSGTIAGDSSGNGNTGTVHGATWVTGILGSALSFDGSSDYVSIPDSPSLDISGNQISVECWMKPTVNLPDIAGNRQLFDKGNAYTAAIMGTAYTVPGTCYGRLPFFADIQSTTTSWASGTWYHIAITYDGSNMRIYVNGHLEKTAPTTGNVLSSGYPLSIGSYCLGTQNFFKGILDEFAIYNYARTAQDILNDYNSVSQGLVGYWKFDEGSGTVAQDSSGNSNTGTLHGPQWVDGIIGKALRFDGVDDYVSIPHSSSLDISGNEISVEYWMKLSTDWYAEPSKGWQYDQIFYDKGDAYTSAMIKSTGALSFNIPYVPPYPKTNKNNWDANIWYHIGEVFDGTQIRIYINGVLDKAETVIGPVSRSGIQLAIGSHCYGDSNFFNGAIDEFAIYNYARTAEEIWNDYTLAPSMPTDKTAVLIDPFYHGAPDDSLITGIIGYLQKAGYSSSWITDSSVSVEWLKTGLKHGIVFWRGHGGYEESYGTSLVTGEIANAENNARYLEDLLSGYLDEVEITEANKITTYWAITPKFIEHYYEANTIPCSLVYVEGCDNMKDSQNRMPIAFQDKGAGAYMGYETYVTAPYGDQQASRVFFDLAIRGYSVKETVEDVRADPIFGWLTPLMSLRWFGDGDLKLTLTKNQGSNLVVAAHSPVDLFITDSMHRSIGINPDTGLLVNEIPGGSYSGLGTEPQIVMIPDPTGTYNIMLLGTATGNYTLIIEHINASQILTQPFNGTISEQEKQYFSAVISETGLTFCTCAKININPDTLNLGSKGQWITAYVELYKDVNVSNINVSSISLNNTIPIASSAPVTIGDYNSDGIPDLMVKFDRTKVTSYILSNVNMTELAKEKFMTVTLTIAGKLNDGTSFQGSTTFTIN